MKNIILALILILLTVITWGCVPTLHCLYSNEVTVYDPNLLGTWAEPNSFETWTLAKSDPNCYAITYSEKDGKTAKFIGHLVKLDKQLFMDIELVGYDVADSDMAKLFLMPIHHIIRIEYSDSKIVFRQMNNDQIKAMLSKNPGFIKHEIINDNVLITASTLELQKFVASNADDTALFKDSVIFVKQ
jgi:hypothetical protein